MLGSQLAEMSACPDIKDNRGTCRPRSIRYPKLKRGIGAKFGLYLCHQVAAPSFADNLPCPVVRDRRARLKPSGFGGGEDDAGPILGAFLQKNDIALIIAFQLH